MITGSVIVLDYSTDEVHIYKLFLKEDTIEQFIKSKGHSPSSCTWMIVEELKLKIH